MPMFPKNSIRSHVAGSVNNANATTNTSKAFKKSAIGTSPYLVNRVTIPESAQQTAHIGIFGRLTVVHIAGNVRVIIAASLVG
jgi:hypothetical protein